MKEALLQELLARQKGKFQLEDVLFDKQVAFILDSSKLKTSVAGRRAGKTYACAVYLIHAALSNAKSKVIYLAITKDYAKSLIWDTLLELNDKYSLNIHFVDSANRGYLSNGAEIVVTGADTAAEVRKLRGHGVCLCIIDETQNFRPHILQDLVDNVISKTLYDYDGTLVLTGTPGPVPIGYFFDCDKGRMAAGFAHHTWTMFDNPHLKRKSGRSPQYLLEQDLKRMGVNVNDPTIRREVFAEWVTDSNALVFHYDSGLNDFRESPTPEPTEFVMGVDIGYDDADAISVLGWSPDSPTIYLVEEFIKSGQIVTDLAEEIDKRIKKYNPLKVVMDTGGLGKKLAEELRRRYALPIEAAEKVRKFEYIELLNDALRTGKFRARASSQFAQDCMLVEWDRTNPQKLAIKDTFHSDICDAVLYAYREALHWLFRPTSPKIQRETPEWYKRIEGEMEQAAIDRLEMDQGIKEGLDPSDD